jgi:hypothetical protein
MKNGDSSIVAEFEVQHVPCPPGHQAEWQSAIRTIAELILAEWKKQVEPVIPARPAVTDPEISQDPGS